MKHELIITFENDYVQIISNGEKSFESSLKIWTNAVKVCQKHNCFKVLGVASSTKMHTTIESYQHGALFHQINIDHKFKIAWVELNPDAISSIKFIETVLLNRGYNVKLFQDVEEAKTWLLKSD
jgi:hypothetical protein